MDHKHPTPAAAAWLKAQDDMRAAYDSAIQALEPMMDEVLDEAPSMAHKLNFLSSMMDERASRYWMEGFQAEVRRVAQNRLYQIAGTMLYEANLANKAHV